MSRPDLKAMQWMREENMCLNEDKAAGIPDGVKPGDTYLSRTELIVVGLHAHTVNGIDTLKVKRQSSRGGPVHKIASVHLCRLQHLSPTLRPPSQVSHIFAPMCAWF
eukprot:1189599-Prorocentrum_minimum.AAC.6